MKIIHISDTHLNFCDSGSRKRFLKSIHDNVSVGGEIIVATGDIAEGPTFAAELFWLSNHVKRPIYFVLGNHDYYHASFRMSEIFANLTQSFNNLKQQINYLSQINKKFTKLKEDTVLIGFNGFYDCKNFKKDEITDFIDALNIQNDFLYIQDLKQIVDQEIPIEDKLKFFRQHAEYENGHLDSKLQELIKNDNFSNIQKIVIATHIPPIYYKNPKEKYEYILPGTDSNQGFMDILKRYADEHKTKQFIVLCGHNHFGGYTEMENIKIYCKTSKYGSPDSILIEI